MGIPEALCEHRPAEFPNDDFFELQRVKSSLETCLSEDSRVVSVKSVARKLRRHPGRQ